MDLKGLLNKNIGEIKSGAKNKTPEKKEMNLYVRQITDNSLRRVLPFAIFLVIVIGIFGKFAVVDRLVELSEKNRKYEETTAIISDLSLQLKDYDSVEERYIRYTEHYKTDEENVLLKREKILKVIDKASSNLATVESISITDNVVLARIVSKNLDDIRKLKTKLENSPFVSLVNVYNADRGDRGTVYEGRVQGSIVINVIDPEKPVIKTKNVEGGN